MKIFITGVAGFVGSHLADYFLARGHEVIGLDMVDSSRTMNIKHILDSPRFNYIHDTILNNNTVKGLVEQADVIYHLAAAVGVENVLGDILNVIRVNVMGTEMIFRFASDFKKKVIFTSTSEIYGKSSKVPFAEDDDSHFGPTSVDRWVYAYSKALGEYISFGYWKEGMPSSTIRIFNAYGPRLDVEGSGRVLSRFIKQLINDEPITIVGDGTQTRCFTYIDDIIKGLVLAGENEKALGNVFNIGNPVEIDIRKLADMLIDISGKKAKVVHIDPKSLYGQGYEDIPRRAPDVRKAKRVLGYEATTPLRDGMERTYKWFLAETNGGRA